MPAVLRASVGGQRELEVDGATVGEVLDGADRRSFPRSLDQLFTPDGELNRFVNVYLNGQDVRYLDGTGTPVDRRRRGAAAARDGGRAGVGRSRGRRRRGPSTRRTRSAAGGDPGRSSAAPACATRCHEELAPHGGRYESILDAIGHTPLVAIPRMSPNPAVRIYAKLEMVNPTGSVKDRAAKYLVEDLERRGRARDRLDHPRADLGQHRDRARDDRAPQGIPGGARDARQRDAASGARWRALFGAEVIDSPGRLGSNGAIALAKHLVGAGPAVRDALPVREPGEPARRTTRPPGPEILADCPEVDVFVAGLGTSGTLMGAGRYPARAQAGGPDRRRRAAPRGERAGSAIARGGFVPEILDPSLLDAKYLVSQPDAIAALRDLVFREGIFAGPSCGAVLVAAAREAQRMSTRHDRGAAARRRLEVPLGGHVRAGPGRDGGRPRGRGQLVVSETGPPARSSPGPTSIGTEIVGPGTQPSIPTRRAAWSSGPPPAASGGRRRCATRRAATGRPRPTATRSTRTTCSGSPSRPRTSTRCSGASSTRT